MAARLIPFRRRRRKAFRGARALVSWAFIIAALALGYQLQNRLQAPKDASQIGEALAALETPGLREALGAVDALRLSEGPRSPEEPPIAYADIRVTDGDTFRLGAERIRIANIDTPEMPGRARCAYEADKALAAKARLAELLASGEITLERDGVDRYGRTLARLRVDGRDVGDQLVREGAAQPWRGRRAEWCDGVS